MAKFGPSDQDAWNPISGDTVAALAAPVTPSKPPTPSAELRVVPEVGEVAEPPKKPKKPKKPSDSDNTKPRTTAVATKGAVKPSRRYAQTGLQTVVRFKITDHLKGDIDKALARLSGTLGVGVNFSQITRSLWELYLNNEDEILDRSGRTPSLRRPSTGDAQALAEFEDAISRTLDEGISGSVARRRLEN